MKYCFRCGDELKEKLHKVDGMVPFCDSCNEFRYPMFNVAVSVNIFNLKRDKVLLIQPFGRKRNILVAGYVNKGESGEEALRREMMEEVSLKAKGIDYNRSEYFKESNTLIFNYGCYVENENFKVDGVEVGAGNWFTIDEARKNIVSGSLAERFMLDYFKKIGK